MIEIPVQYGGDGGPDLNAVAGHAGCSEQEVIARHTQRTYRVYMLGFVPGFAYMGRVDPAIAAPRHRVPRERVPAGSVGIAGGQTGVYPVDSPGGWQLIGRTATVMFDANRAAPSLLAPGDLVRFVAVAALHEHRRPRRREARVADHGAGPRPIRPSGVRCAGGRSDGCLLASAGESAGRQ